jgi:7-cyano-7-deazaguanine synthase in queuosine biosynthesis
MKVVLHSGGFDSSALFSIDDDLTSLFINWNQPSIIQEDRASILVCNHLDVDRRTIEIPYLNSESMKIGIGQSGSRVVQSRNLTFIAAASTIPGVTEIWLGASRDDQEEYPDCVEDFIRSCDTLLNRTYGIRVKAPLIKAPKSEIVRIATDLGIMEMCWTCYQPSNDKPCGKCNSCRRFDESLDSISCHGFTNVMFEFFDN